MGEEAKSGASVKQEGGALVKSRACELKTMDDGLPSYGAQHRQDALWEGGNEALPPGWHGFDDNGHITRYQDDNLFFVSSKRPLPGVRLDYPGQLLVPGCEWHISPLGRSYFVNHNNRTTSWKKPTPERSPGCLSPKYIIKGHSDGIWSVACVGKNRSVISASEDGSIRQWTRDGKTIGQPWQIHRPSVGSIAVSPDETMVVSGSIDGRIRLWDIKDGRIVGKPWEGHNDFVRCLDWSPDGQEIVSGSQDGTIRRWNRTGQQIAPPIEVGQGWWATVKYSPQSDKFAACGPDDITRIWSKNGKLLIDINEPDGHWVRSLCWSMDGTCIFSGSGNGTIRKWRLVDREELIVLRGHTKTVMSLCLTLDECYLLSASMDYSVRTWDLGTGSPVGEPLWHDDQVWTVAMPPDRRYIASGGLDTRVYLWDFEATLKQGSNQSTHDNNLRSNAKLKQHMPSSGDILDISTKSQLRLNNTSLSKYGDNFWGIDPHRSTGGSAPLSNPSSATRRNFFDFLRFNPRPVDRSRQMPRQRRGWNVSLSLRRISSHTAKVPASHDDDRCYVTPPTAAEKAKASQDEPVTAVDDSALQDGSVPERTKPTPGGNFTTGDEGRDNDAEYSAYLTLDSNKDKGKKREDPIFPVRTPSSNGLCPEQTWKPFFKWSRKLNNDDMELRGRRPPVVDVPFAHRKHFYYTRKQVQMDKKREEEKKKKKEEEKNKMIAKHTINHPPNSSPSTQSNAPQQSTGSQVPEPQTVFVASSTAPADAPITAMSTTSLHHTITPRTGCWTRFWLWLFRCCTSAEYPHD